MLYLLYLIFLQIIWTGSYVAMKLATAVMPVGLVLIFRYGIATLVFLALGYFRGGNKFTRKEWLLIIVVGIANYSLSPFFQMKSLQLTQVIDVSVLVATEPLITALIASLLLREKLGWDLVVVFVLATVGAMILSGVNPTQLAVPLTGTRLLGNGLFVFALCFEGINSTTGRYLTQRNDPIVLAAWMHGAGFAANLAANYPLLQAVPMHQASITGWLSVLYLGVFCSALGYGSWYWLVKKVPVSRLALSLFLQPVIGIFLGYFLMKEEINLQMVIGTGLIVITLLGWMLKNLRQESRKTAVMPREGFEPPRLPTGF